MSSKRVDKFKVGDTAWLPGDWRVRDRDKFFSHTVLERTKTGYVMLATRAPSQPEHVSTVKANRDYFTTQAKEDWEWQRVNRRKIANKVEEADTATLRKIAELIGYKAE